jgi:hypothetical protein
MLTVLTVLNWMVKFLAEITIKSPMISYCFESILIAIIKNDQHFI